MEDNKLTIPYIAFESAMDRMDRKHRLDFIIIVILILMLALTNIAWLIAWNSYDYVTEDDYSVDIDTTQGDGVNIVGAGDIGYGTDSQSNYQEEKDTEQNA